MEAQIPNKPPKRRTLSSLITEHLLCRVPLLYRALFPGARWRIPAITGRSVYLTFDDGPIPEATPWVLDCLDVFGVKATFFCVADNVRKYPHIFAEIKARGHQIGNHTYHHLKGLTTSTSKYMQDVYDAHQLIQSRYFRPPYGHIRFSQVRDLSHSFEIIMWDLITRDYNPALSPEDLFNTVTRYTRNGSIIVFHDSIKSIDNLKIALPQCMKWLLHEGFEFKRIGDAP